MSAADEVARLEAETVTAVSASVVAQAAAAEAVRDAENLKHEVTREAAEAIRERDAEIETLKGEVAWLKNETTNLKSELESQELAMLGLVTMLNPPLTESPQPIPPVVSNVDVVDPEAAKTKVETQEPMLDESQSKEPPKSTKRHRLL